MNNEIKEYFDPGKKNLILIYVFYLAVTLTPSLPLLGAIFAFVNKSNSTKIYKSHYIFALRSFVIGFIGYVIISFLSPIFLIPFIAFMTFLSGALYASFLVWFITRCIIALQYLLADRAHPHPLTFWIK